MALRDITIYRALPIVNGYVKIPPNNPLDNIRVAVNTDIPYEVVELPIGSRYGKQQFLRLPGVRADEWYESNPLNQLT